MVWLALPGGAVRRCVWLHGLHGMLVCHRIRVQGTRHGLCCHAKAVGCEISQDSGDKSLGGSPRGMSLLTTGIGVHGIAVAFLPIVGGACVAVTLPPAKGGRHCARGRGGLTRCGASVNRSRRLGWVVAEPCVGWRLVESTGRVALPPDSCARYLSSDLPPMRWCQACREAWGQSGAWLPGLHSPHAPVLQTPSWPPPRVQGNMSPPGVESLPSQFGSGTAGEAEGVGGDVALGRRWQSCG